MIAKAQRQHVPRLGEGAYSLAEAARYTRLHYGRVRAWFRGRSDGEGSGVMLPGDFKRIGDDFAVSFLDMIDALVAGQFRTQGVSLHTVRRAHAILQSELATLHPFCHEHLYTDGRRIIRLAGAQADDATLRDVISRQQFFDQVRAHLHRMDYSTTTGLVECWRITDGVVIDPSVSLGKPVIAATGVTTHALAAQYKANRGDEGLVADLFDVSPKDVLIAVGFEADTKKHHAA